MRSAIFTQKTLISTSGLLIPSKVIHVHCRVSALYDKAISADSFHVYLAILFLLRWSFRLTLLLTKTANAFL